MVVASILVRTLPSLALTNIDTYSCIIRSFSVIYASFYRLFRFDVKQSVFRLFPCKMCALKGLYLHGIWFFGSGKKTMTFLKKAKTFLKKLKVFKKKLLIFFENDLIFQSWFTYVCISLHIRMCSSLRTYVKKRAFWHAGCLRKMLHNPSLLLQWNKNAGNCNKCFIEVAGCPLLLLQKNF